MADTEKVTINLSVVDLGRIDVLVDEGLYSSRTDLIRTAIRNQLERHEVELTQAMARGAFVVGALAFDRESLERSVARNERLKITVVGLLSIAADVTPELAARAIESVKIRGVFKATEDVKAVLADRTA